MVMGDPKAQNARKTKEQMQWEKAPAVVEEPSSSSGTSSTDIPEPGRGNGGCRLPSSGKGWRENDRKHVETGKTIPMPPSETDRIPRKESRNHVEKSERLDDLSAQLKLDEEQRAAKPLAKQGILLNAQFESESKKLKKGDY